MTRKAKSAIHKCLQRFFISLVILHVCQVTAQPRTYPRKLHERVLAKLNQRRNGFIMGKFGTWGSWSSWSPCSRSCGTGVTTQSRECRMPKVRKRIQEIDMKRQNRCVGRYKRFQLCNTQECPTGMVDFRREQCSAFNRTPFNRRYYSWEPFVESSDSCTLNCRAVGLSFYATLNQSVVDGTPCGIFHPQLRQQNRICVGGKCMKVGCDGLLGSGRDVDACGLCGGDNSTCRLISGVYTRASLPFGYNLIASLPPGAKNLSIYHIKPSRNYLALKEVGGNYILNGPWGLNLSASFEASGTIFTYSRPHAHGGDHLYARGPTSHSLDVMLFYQGPDPGIRYEYRLSPQPEDTLRSKSPDGGNTFLVRVPEGAAPRTPSTSGLVNDAISVNAVSKNGAYPPSKYVPRTKKTKFKDGRDGKFKDKIKKENDPKNKKRRKRYLWIVNGFTPCSQTCGGGTQTTRTICVKRKRKEVEAPVHFCAGLPLPREEVVRCNLRPCPPQWEADPWTPCSVTCGIGTQTRSMACRQRVSPDVTINVPAHECRDANPIVTAQVCQMRDCNATPKWDVQPWSPCSSQCGLGTRHRNVSCTSIHGLVEEHFCKDLKPLEEEMCDMGSCASDTWFFSAWDPMCRGPCENGVQTRHIYCSGDALEGGKEYSSCPQGARPPDTRSCSNEKACGGSWFAGPWSDCDTDCGTRRQRRAVVCVTWQRGLYKVARSPALCKAAGEKPPDSRPCAVECRARWFTSEWSECSASCEDGVQRREVKCLDQQHRPSLECPSATKPDSRQTCNTHPCKTEHLNDSAIYDHPQKLPNDSSASADTQQTSSEAGPKTNSFQTTSKGKESSLFVDHRNVEGQTNDATKKKISLTPFYQFSQSRETSVTHSKGAGRRIYGGKPKYEDENSFKTKGKSGADEVSLSSETSKDLQYRRRILHPGPPLTPDTCIDRMKNCHLVYKARLCRLKYYNSLCCDTCSQY